MSSNRENLNETLLKIPSGQTLSYGLLAQRINIKFGTNLTGRSVGRLLSKMSEKDKIIYPWRRVINKQRQISALKLGQRGIIQIKLLEKEGVKIDKGVVDKDFFVG